MVFSRRFEIHIALVDGHAWESERFANLLEVEDNTDRTRTAPSQSRWAGHRRGVAEKTPLILPGNVARQIAQFDQVMTLSTHRDGIRVVRIVGFRDKPGPENPLRPEAGK
jgi:hypothetical protein